VGTIATIACGSATNNGTLTSGTAASSVSSIVSYTSGNGGTHSGQTVTSTGVTGLTATLSSGTFLNGSGTLTYNITGTPSSAGTASFAINIGGQTCTLTRTVSAAVTCLVGATTVVDVVNATTGKTWMDRNLGAHQVATSSTDALAYGDYFQFGRSADGHQCRNSSTTTTRSSVDVPGNATFILHSNGWRTSTTELWNGVNGVNNPCPTGYRLPTSAEFTSEANSWSSQGIAGAFASNRKWTLSGGRVGDTGNMIWLGDTGYFWSSTWSSSTNSLGIMMNLGNGYVTTSGTQTNQANGFPVRCIKN
jgi:uncharacterized protein (TIGR02145 family)